MGMTSENSMQKRLSCNEIETLLRLEGSRLYEENRRMIGMNGGTHPSGEYIQEIIELPAEYAPSRNESIASLYSCIIWESSVFVLSTLRFTRDGSW